MKRVSLVLMALLVSAPCFAQEGDRAAGDVDWDDILNLKAPEAQARAQPEERGASASASSAGPTKRPKADGERPRSKAERRDKARQRREERERKASAVPAGYEALKRSWHEPWAGEEPAQEPGAPRSLTLHPVGRASSPVVLVPRREDGGFDTPYLLAASHALGSWSGGPVVSERLLELIYHAAKHFEVFHVHVVSGIRRDRSASRHSHGLAADIVLPGVDDELLAGYFRAQGFVGVGVYTRAGFVHIDVRERSYFWIDRSPPGRRYKIQQVRADEAKAADEAALARGQTGYVNPSKLQRALSARAQRRARRAR